MFKYMVLLQQLENLTYPRLLRHIIIAESSKTNHLAKLGLQEQNISDRTLKGMILRVKENDSMVLDMPMNEERTSN